MKKANVIVLFGQSNAEGYSISSYLRKEKQDKFSKNFSRTKILFNCNYSTNVSKTFVNVTLGQAVPMENERFGPEIGIAEGLADASLDEETYIVKYTLGGTALWNFWSPVEPYGELYIGIKEYIKNAINLLRSLGKEAKVAAFCFHQGESDSNEDKIKALNYEEKENLLINGLVKFCKENEFIYENYMFIDCKIFNNADVWINHQIVNDAKSNNVTKDSAHRMIIDPNSEGLSCLKEPYENPDVAHYDAEDMLKIGHMFAKAIILSRLLGNIKVS